MAPASKIVMPGSSLTPTLLTVRMALSEAPVDLLTLFERSKDTKTYPAGSVIFTEGDEGDFAYVVMEGEVELQVKGQIVHVVDAGDIFGEMALLKQEPRVATATAKTDCSVVYLDQNRFMFMVQQVPFFAVHVMRVLADRLRTMDNRL
jgi:CRP-like cAMP-binding protein